MKNRTVSLSLIALVAGIVLGMAGYLTMHPQKVKAQPRQVQAMNTVRTVTFVQSNSIPHVVAQHDRQK